jgi:hypothetical protein
MKLSTIWWNPYCSVFRYQDGENLSKILPIDIFFRHVFTRGDCLEKGIIWNDVFIFVICYMLIHERIWKGSNGAEVHLRSVLYSWLVDDVINHELRTWVKTLPSKCLFAVHKLFLYVYERSMIARSIRWWMKGQHWTLSEIEGGGDETVSAIESEREACFIYFPRLSLITCKSVFVRNVSVTSIVILQSVYRRRPRSANPTDWDHIPR